MQEINSILKLLNSVYTDAPPYKAQYSLESDVLVCNYTLMSGEQPLPCYTYDVFNTHFSSTLYKANSYFPIIKPLIRTGSELRTLLVNPKVRVDGEVIERNNKVYYSEQGKEVLETFNNKISKEVTFVIDEREGFVITTYDNEHTLSLDTRSEYIIFFNYLKPSKIKINIDGKETMVTPQDIEEFATNSQVGIEEEVEPSFIAQSINSIIYEQLVDGVQETPEQSYFYSAMAAAGYNPSDENSIVADIWLRNEFILDSFGPYDFYSFESTSESRWWLRHLVEYLNEK